MRHKVPWVLKSFPGGNIPLPGPRDLWGGLVFGIIPCRLGRLKLQSLQFGGKMNGRIFGQRYLAVSSWSRGKRHVGRKLPYAWLQPRRIPSRSLYPKTADVCRMIIVRTTKRYRKYWFCHVPCAIGCQVSPGAMSRTIQAFEWYLTYGSYPYDRHFPTTIVGFYGGN